jgi:hypothetical protein
VSLKGWKSLTVHIAYHNVSVIKFDLSQIQKTKKPI